MLSLIAQVGYYFYYMKWDSIFMGERNVFYLFIFFMNKYYTREIELQGTTSFPLIPESKRGGKLSKTKEPKTL